MSFNEDFIKNAIAAVETGASLQSTVRAFIDESISNELDTPGIMEVIADSITSFRQITEESMIRPLSGREKLEMRKKINNVINDTSRLCRELLGMTIKCRHRKNHVYGWEPAPVKAVRVKSEATITATADVADHTAVFEKMIEEYPELTIRELLKIHGKEKVGRWLIDIIKELDAQS